ncbi:MAG: hypothetical protein ACI8WT_001572 [Clostridium sp.]|jgi:uncharacterized protein (TIGR04540 family)
MVVNTKSFYKSQREVADAFNLLIDGYWSNEVCEEVFIENVKKIAENNETKVFTKKGQFPAILIQKCGKRRLEVISKILEVEKG